MITDEITRSSELKSPKLIFIPTFNDLFINTYSKSLAVQEMTDYQSF